MFFFSLNTLLFCSLLERRLLMQKKKKINPQSVIWRAGEKAISTKPINPPTSDVRDFLN